MTNAEMIKETRRSINYLEKIRDLSPVGRFGYYISERFKIYTRRTEGQSREQWTLDPILQAYKFTNVKRDWDFTSQWLINNWYTPKLRYLEYSGMTAAFARFFCLVRTFERVGYPEHRIGNLPQQDLSLWLHRAEKVLVLASQKGEKVFTSAYMIAGGGSAGRNKVEWVINDILRPVLKSRILLSAWPDSIDAMHQRLKEFNGLGDFMTQEIVLDLMKTTVLLRRPQEEKRLYAYAGPGALRGLNRIWRNDVDSYAKTKAKDEMLALYDMLRQTSLIPPALRKDLVLHDVEFSLCEFDKYERILWGQGRPKQNFIPREDHEQGRLL